jgi:hypothetical protein
MSGIRPRILYSGTGYEHEGTLLQPAFERQTSIGPLLGFSPFASPGVNLVLPDSQRQPKSHIWNER